MPGWMISLMSVQVLILSVPQLSLRVEPGEGSLAGGTWLTVTCDGLDPGVLYPSDGSQLEISLVSTAAPALPRVPCDVTPVFLEAPVVMCQTRSLQSEAYEGLYSLEVCSGAQVVCSPGPAAQDNCTFKFSKAETPVIHRVNPPSGVPGKLIHVYGWIITGRLETFDADAEYIDSPLVLEAQREEWITPCSLIDRQTGAHYPLLEDGGLGRLTCRVEGDYIGLEEKSDHFKVLLISFSVSREK